MKSADEQPFRYDPFSAEAMRAPYSFYPVLREQHPAYYLPDYDTYVFSRYQDVWDGFMDAEHYSEAEGQIFARSALLKHNRGRPPEPKIHPEKAMFLFLDPPLHTRFRQALAAPFLMGNIRKLEPTIRDIVRTRLLELLARGSFDLNSDLASYVTVRVSSAVMGLANAEPDRIVRLINRMVARAPNQSGMTPDGAVARGELYSYLESEIRRRRAGIGPESPAIDPLLNEGLMGRLQSDAEIAVDISSLLVGGTETVPKVFAGGLVELWRQPEQLAAVAARYDANTDELVLSILYRGTNPRHTFELQWGQCRNLAPEPGEKQISDEVLDKQWNDSALHDYERTVRFSPADLGCRPARVTLRTAPRFYYTLDIPAARSSSLAGRSLSQSGDHESRQGESGWTIDRGNSPLGR